MMTPGFSKPWPDALKEMTGTSQMDATSLINYFEPLYQWLQKANSMAKDCVGWGGLFPLKTFQRNQ